MHLHFIFHLNHIKTSNLVLERKTFTYCVMENSTSLLGIAYKSMKAMLVNMTSEGGGCRVGGVDNSLLWRLGFKSPCL